jgi:hypothetical protein
MDERVQQLDRIRLARTDGTFELGDEAFHRVSLYNDLEERKRDWTEELSKSWDAFSTRAMANGRLQMTRYEWRYLLECADGRSMVTGLPFGQDGRHIDRVFNMDAYSLKNCLVMEGSLNYAKSYMQVFQDSQGFEGDKGRFGIDTLRDELDRQEQATRPHRGQ